MIIYYSPYYEQIAKSLETPLSMGEDGEGWKRQIVDLVKQRNTITFLWNLQSYSAFLGGEETFLKELRLLPTPHFKSTLQGCHQVEK